MGLRLAQFLTRILDYVHTVARAGASTQGGMEAVASKLS